MQMVSNLDSSSTSAIGAPSSPRTRGEPSTRGVLVVEDDADHAALVAWCARSKHISIEMAPTLASARHMLQHASYDAILLDLRLPDGQQLEVVDAILPLAGATPVIVLTGLDDEEMAHRCLDRGVQDYLRKADLTPQVLARTVEHAVVRRRSVELRRRLDLAEQEASFGRLAGAVAHEINNQLTPLLVNLEQARRRVREARRPSDDRPVEAPAELLDDLLERLDIEHDGLWRVASLVREMQRFLRGARDVRPPSPVDLNDAVGRTLKLARNALEPVASLQVELEASACVLADLNKLVQVILNLLTNAAEACDEAHEQDARIRIRTEDRGAMVALVVTDNGVGMSEALKARIFEPFFSSKTARRGTGLGLAVCSDIVQQYGGVIEADDEPGGGTRFTVLLPRTSAPSEAPPPPQPHEQPRARRVLLIDDDPAVRSAMESLIAEHHEVVSVERGADAVALLQRDRRFDAIVCDLMMPGMDGVAVCEAVRALDPTLLRRVILLSGGAFTDRTQSFLDAIEQPVLSKPCSGDELLAMIDDVAAHATLA